MALKRRNTGQNGACESPWKVWVVPLKQQKYYIAYSKEDNKQEVQEKEYVKIIGIEKIEGILGIDCSSEHEGFWICFKKSIEMMQNYGIENVRSDVFPDMILNPMIVAYIENLIKHRVVTCYVDLMCSQCGRKGHSADVCYARSQSKGYLEDEYSDYGDLSSSS